MIVGLIGLGDFFSPVSHNARGFEICIACPGVLHVADSDGPSLHRRWVRVTGDRIAALFETHIEAGRGRAGALVVNHVADTVALRCDPGVADGQIGQIGRVGHLHRLVRHDRPAAAGHSRRDLLAARITPGVLSLHITCSGALNGRWLAGCLPGEGDRIGGTVGDGAGMKGIGHTSADDN